MAKATFSDWIEWPGGECPVEGHVRVHVQLGGEFREQAESANAPEGLPAHFFAAAWLSADPGSRITAYRRAVV